MRLERTENLVRLTTLCLSSLCIPSSLSTIASSFSIVLMSIRCCMVSCSTLCTRLSLFLTSRVSFRMWPTYILLVIMNSGSITTISAASSGSMENR